MLSTPAAPAYQGDLYSDEAIAEPYEHYRAIRDLGPVVWLPSHSIFAMGRHAEVLDALRDHQTYSSRCGIAVSEQTNSIAAGTTISSDPPEHDKLRKIVGEPLTLAAVAKLQPQIEAAAEALVNRLTAAGSFDAATELAQHLPLSIVSHMVGLPEAGREKMLTWAAGTFDLFGPENDRTRAARPIVLEMRAYLSGLLSRDKVKASSWADLLLDKVDSGEIALSQVSTLLRDYLGPSLDTTIFATANLIWLFGENPDQWDLVRNDPSLIKNAVNEAIRLESPIRGFTRSVTKDIDIGGVRLHPGARVLLLYGSANRDERKWEDPDRFNVRRRLQGQLGFGFGVHSCAGMHLARLEIESLVKALVPRVKRFMTAPPTRAINNTLRGFASLPVKIVT